MRAVLLDGPQNVYTLGHNFANNDRCSNFSQEPRHLEYAITLHPRETLL